MLDNSPSNSENSSQYIPGIYDRLEIIQDYLVSEAQKGLTDKTFDARNGRMVEAVSVESSIQAARATRSQGQVLELRNIFIQACTEAGDSFKEAFNENGNPLYDKEDKYKLAIKSAGRLAYKHLPIALKTIGINFDQEKIDEIIKKADFRNILELSIYEITRNMPRDTIDFNRVLTLESKEIKQSLDNNTKNQYGKSLIGAIKLNEEHVPLTEDEMLILETAIRLTNATWKVGQVHRAVWEGNDSRIDPDQRNGVFSAYDLLKRKQFEIYRDQGLSDQDAILQIALEIYKDKSEYDQLLNQDGSK